MDIGKAFAYVFEDPRWVTKVLIGGVLGLVAIVLSYLIILVIGLLAIVPYCVILGYSTRLMRNVLAGEERPLPEWSDVGALLADGARLFVVGLAYLAPIVAFGLVAGLVGAALGATDATEGAAAGPAIAFSCATLLYGLAVWVVFPAAAGEYASTGRIGAALRVGHVLGLVRGHLGDFLVVFLLGIVASVLGGLGVLACGIGLVFTYPYSAYVMGHLWAQVYQKARGGGTPPAAPSTPL